MSYIDDNITQSFPEYFDKEVECYGLQALTDNTDFNDALDDLEDYIEDNEEDEMGYEISRTDNVLSTNFKPGEYGKVRLAFGSNIIGGMHTHPEHGYPIFSAEDLYTLYNYYLKVKNNNPNVSQHDVFLTLTTHGTYENPTYMIKIKDFSMLGFVINKYNLQPGNKRAYQRFNRILTKKYESNSNINDFMRLFLQTFEDIKAEYGMSKTPIFLYKLNVDTNTFEKVGLDGNNPPTKTPCN